MPDLLNSQVGLTEGEEKWGKGLRNRLDRIILFAVSRNTVQPWQMRKTPTAKKRLYDICKNSGNYDETGLTYFTKTGRRGEN